MPKIDLGRVRGEDARFGNITSSYINDGGEPGVDIVPSGPDTGKDLDFEFRNLVNDPLSSSEIEQIANGEVVNSANVLNGTGLTTLWARIKEKFAAKAHRHSAADIEEGQFGADRIEDNAITSAKIADGAVGQEQLDPAVWESISQGLKLNAGYRGTGGWFNANDLSLTLSFVTYDGMAYRCDLINGKPVSIKRQ